MRPAIYILTNKWNRVLYTGVTADLQNRLRVHRGRLDPHCFTARYNVSKLVCFEFHPTMLAAIARESIPQPATLLRCCHAWHRRRPALPRRMPRRLAAQ